MYVTYREAKVILEYGSGGSTVLAANMPGKLTISVESDRKWSLDLQRKLNTASLASPVIIWHADIGPTGEWGRPLAKMLGGSSTIIPHRYGTRPFFRHPDLILIDGRFRPACFVTACMRISRPVTVLFDDYTNRPAYHVVEKLAKPRRIVGRMAEFRIEPDARPFWVQDMLMDLCTQATVSTQTSFDYGRKEARGT
ncbi:hypothetical protein [Cereibacter sphaeroides]|uniref:hypothetical protein n=1 Tax=Cereibacter sphaeroides TaxID=1063 RepID=UPI001F1969FF|nr:hypothetical protein [Cereibacter sphaeroides]MCE6967245.1 hypothetical protein [Cereibacter sphaeroides]